MFKAPESEFLVPFDGSFQISGAPTSVGDLDEDACKQRLKDLGKELADLQRVLYADDRYAILLVFQAMDAGGKDSTIRAVMKRVNPAGCQVFSFQPPSPLELDHDFLWRTSMRMPQRGRIGIFNRSQYEEVLAVRVHPDLLEKQKLPFKPDPDHFWDHRLESIRDQELHLARSGTVILKFWLNISREEQKDRFLSRLDKPHKHWKFSESDVDERQYWDQYMEAYEEALNATSRSWAPWYAVPADNKPFMRATVAQIIVDALTAIDLEYPDAPDSLENRLQKIRKELEQS